MGRDDGNALVDIDPVLMMFSENKPKAMKLYRAYMSDSKGLKKEEVYDSASQCILGNDEFIERVMKQCSGKGIKPRRRKEYSLADIAGGVKRKFGISLAQLRGGNKSEPLSLGRKIITLIAEEYGYKRKEIAEFMEKDPAVVTRYLRERKSLALEMESVRNIPDGGLLALVQKPPRGKDPIWKKYNQFGKGNTNNQPQ